MTFLLHGAPCAGQYLVDVGKLVAVSAVDARDAYSMARALATQLHAMAAEQLCGPQFPMVYQFDPQGELIAVFD